jgi:hypothetical protein
MTDRESHIKLTVDVSDYLAGMKAASRATIRFRLTRDFPALAVGLTLGIAATLAAVYIR